MYFGRITTSVHLEKKMPTLSQSNILIVEDNEEVLRDMYSCIEEHMRRRNLSTVRVRHASYLGYARTKIADADYATPSVISVDMEFPISFKGKVDPFAGIKLIRELHSLHGIKIIMYSGYPVSRSKDILTQSGILESGNDPGIIFLQKRFDTSHDVWAKQTLDALFTR